MTENSSVPALPRASVFAALRRDRTPGQDFAVKKEEVLGRTGRKVKS